MLFQHEHVLKDAFISQNGPVSQTVAELWDQALVVGEPSAHPGTSHLSIATQCLALVAFQQGRVEHLVATKRVDHRCCVGCFCHASRRS